MPTTTHTAHPTPAPKCIAARQNGIEISAQKTLQSSSYSELRRIRCEQARGKLVLRGSVSSYFLKQLAQESVMATDGIGQIMNAIEVRPRAK